MRCFVILYHHPGREPSLYNSAASLATARLLVARYSRKHKGAKFTVHVANIHREEANEEAQDTNTTSSASEVH